MPLIASINSKVKNNHGEIQINLNKIFLLGIDIYGQDFHGVVDNFTGKKRADNIKLSTNLTVRTVCTYVHVYKYTQ